MYKGGAVYILSSVSKRVLYVGVTSDLKGRIWEHKDKKYPTSFSAKYNCILLVYFKYYDTIEEAIAEEKRIKAGNREQKEALINSINPLWTDLYNELEY
jgi:putative endonuclease